VLLRAAGAARQLQLELPPNADAFPDTLAIARATYTRPDTPGGTPAAVGGIVELRVSDSALEPAQDTDSGPPALPIALAGGAVVALLT
jgi:hypothetical protein